MAGSLWSISSRSRPRRCRRPDLELDENQEAVSHHRLHDLRGFLRARSQSDSPLQEFGLTRTGARRQEKFSQLRREATQLKGTLLPLEFHKDPLRTSSRESRATQGSSFLQALPRRFKQR